MATVLGRPATADDLVDPTWQPTDKELLVVYLGSSPAALVGQVLEEACPKCGRHYHPALFRSDGERLWTDNVRHSVEYHELVLPDRWVEAIRARDYAPPSEIDGDTYFRLAPGGGTPN